MGFFGNKPLNMLLVRRELYVSKISEDLSVAVMEDLENALAGKDGHYDAETLHEVFERHGIGHLSKQVEESLAQDTIVPYGTITMF